MARPKTMLFSTSEELLVGYGLKADSKKCDSEKIEKEARKVYLRGKVLSSGNISLFLDYCNPSGKREKRYLKNILCIETSKDIKEKNKEILRQSQTIAKEADASAQRDENGFTISKKAKTNLKEYILFQADEALKKSGNPHGYYYTLIALSKHIVLYSGEKTTLEDVDRKYLLNFIEYLKIAKNFNYKRTGDSKKDKDISISPNTQHNLFAKFKYVIKKAIKAKIIASNPFDELENSEKPKEEDGTREFLTVDEIKRLIVTPCRNEILKRAFLFSCLTGLRYSDVSSITWDEFRKDNNGDIYLLFKMQKVKRANSIYVSDEALKWLPEKGEAKDDDVIFNLPKNDHANKQLHRWIKEAGIAKKITFHCSRHTAATLNLSLGVPIETVCRLMGHTKISTTQIYAKVLNESQKSAVSKQNGLFD